MSELPSQWTDATIDDLKADDPVAITDGPFGSNLKAEHYTLKGARVIRLNNLAPLAFIDEDKAFISFEHYERLRKHEAKPGDLVVAALGDPLGRTCSVPQGIGPAIVKADCFRMRPSPEIDRDYLIYWLNSPTAARWFVSRSHGLGRKRINLRDFREAPVPLAPLQEQRRISGKLDALSARTKAARQELIRIPILIDRYKQAILQNAFNGELTADWRADAGELESAKDLAARTPAPDQSRGGRSATSEVIEGVAGLSVNDPGTPLPEGWDWVSLRRIARQETGHTPSRSKPEWWGGDICWIGIKDANLHHGRVIHDTIQKTNERGLTNSSARLLPAGTVCLSRTASVGYVTVMGRDMATSQDFATWTCTDALLPKYLMYALMSEGDEMRRFGEGSTHTTIYFPEIRAFYIKLAPLTEQEEIVSRIERAFAQIERLAQEADRAHHLLAHLDQGLLAKAFRGELVPQDPSDEPAVKLLESIRAADKAEVPKRRSWRRKVAARKNSRAEG